MTSISPLAGAVATIVAALVAATLTYLVSVFTKEAKISEFRQAWIDGLRQDTAGFIGTWYYVAAELELIDPAEFSTRDFWRSMKSEWLELEILQARIELRLNPTEHSQAIEQIKFLSEGESLTGLAHAQRKAEIEAFAQQIQTILKSEWARVKRGEPTYRLVKKASRVLLSAAAIALVASVILHQLYK